MFGVVAVLALFDRKVRDDRLPGLKKATMTLHDKRERPTMYRGVSHTHQTGHFEGTPCGIIIKKRSFDRELLLLAYMDA